MILSGSCVPVSHADFLGNSALAGRVAGGALDNTWSPLKLTGTGDSQMAPAKKEFIHHSHPTCGASLPFNCLPRRDDPLLM